MSLICIAANAEDPPPLPGDAPSAAQLMAVSAVSQLTVASSPVRSAPVQSSYALERRAKHEHRAVDTAPAQVLLDIVFYYYTCGAR